MKKNQKTRKSEKNTQGRYYFLLLLSFFFGDIHRTNEQTKRTKKKHQTGKEKRMDLRNGEWKTFTMNDPNW